MYKLCWIRHITWDSFLWVRMITIFTCLNNFKWRNTISTQIVLNKKGIFSYSTSENPVYKGYRSSVVSSRSQAISIFLVYHRRHLLHPLAGRRTTVACQLLHLDITSTETRETDSFWWLFIRLINFFFPHQGCPSRTSSWQIPSHISMEEPINAGENQFPLGQLDPPLALE